MDLKLLPTILTLVIACLVKFAYTLEMQKSVKCYECNVWKAGYGQLCDNPRIRDDCLFCMKVETTIFMGYYKNTPRSSTIISKICGKTKIPHFGHECDYYTMADGMSIECYCDNDMCNSAPNGQRSSLMALAICSVITWSARRWLS